MAKRKPGERWREMGRQQQLNATLTHRVVSRGFERPDPPGVESDGPGLATIREGPWIMTKMIIFRGRDARVGRPKNEIGHPKNDRAAQRERLREKRQSKAFLAADAASER